MSDEIMTTSELANRLLAYVQGALARMAYGSAGCIEDMHVFELLRDQGMLQDPETMEQEAYTLLHHWFPCPGTHAKYLRLADVPKTPRRTFTEALLQCALAGDLTESMAREWLEGEDLERALALLKREEAE